MQHQKNNKQSLTPQSQNESEEQKQVNKLGMLLNAVEAMSLTPKSEIQKMLETDSKIVRRKPIPTK